MSVSDHQLEIDQAKVVAEVERCATELHEKNPGLSQLIAAELLLDIGTFFFTSGMLYDRGESYDDEQST